MCIRDRGKGLRGVEFSIVTHYWLIQTSAEKLHVHAGCQSSVSCWLSLDHPVMSSHSSLSLRLSCSQECFNYRAYPGLFFFFLSPGSLWAHKIPAISEYFIWLTGLEISSFFHYLASVVIWYSPNPTPQNSYCHSVPCLPVINTEKRRGSEQVMWLRHAYHISCSFVLYVMNVLY